MTILSLDIMSMGELSLGFLAIVGVSTEQKETASFEEGLNSKVKFALFKMFREFE